MNSPEQDKRRPTLNPLAVQQRQRATRELVLEPQNYRTMICCEVPADQRATSGCSQCMPLAQRRDDYSRGRWCGECMWRVEMDPPCCYRVTDSDWRPVNQK